MPQFGRYDEERGPFQRTFKTPDPSTGIGGTPSAPPVPAESGLPDFEFPTYSGPMAPQFRMPHLQGYDAPDFEVPTFEQAQAEPGYQFRLDTGRKALENSAAARGLLRTGGTLKDFINYGQNYGAQEYQNVFNRALQAYQERAQAARDEYAPIMAQWQGALGLEQQRGMGQFDRAYDLYNNDLENARYQDAVIRGLYDTPPPQMPMGEF